MKFKKLCALLLAGAMTLSLAACGQKEAPAASTPAPAASAPAASTPAPAEPETVPAYSVEGFETVDADGNRTTYDLLQVPASWTKVRIHTKLPKGLARIGVQTKAKAGNWFCVDDVKLVRNGD